MQYFSLGGFELLEGTDHPDAHGMHNNIISAHMMLCISLRLLKHSLGQYKKGIEI
jgi:hypothetical protein